MNKKFIFGIIIAILLLAPLVSAFSISGLFNWITGKAAEGVQDLSAYPAPFVQKNGASDVMIIYGADAPAIYMETVSIFASSLASYLIAQGGGKLGDVIMIDTEAEASKPPTNLIVVGGANVNTLAAKLCPPYSSSSQYDTLVECGYGGGMALLKLYPSPYNPAKKALLVAGWTGESTRYVANLYVSSQVFREGLIGKNEEVVSLPEHIRIEEREAEIEEVAEPEKEEKKATEEEEALKEKLAGCMGCSYDTTCVPFGERLKIDEISSYCSIDSVFRPQMPIDAQCENDYECLSNECSNGKCISTYTLLQKIFEFLKTIFGKGWLWGK